MEGAIYSWDVLTKYFDCYILSTPSWGNPDVWSEKRIWVEENLGPSAHKKLILTHNKGLLKGDYLIDDRVANGVLDFEGEHIHFGSLNFIDWSSVLKYLLKKRLHINTEEANRATE